MPETPGSSSSRTRKRKLFAAEEEEEEQYPPLVIRRKTPLKSKQQLALVERCRKKFNFKVLLPNESKSVHLTLEDPDVDMSVNRFISLIKERVTQMEAETGRRPAKLRWGTNLSLENALGYKIEDGQIFSENSDKKAITLILHDGARDTVHSYEDMWDVTPDPNVLSGMPQDYTIETALADLIDNSLQAVWSNKEGERRLISVEIGNHEISIFDSGQGMDSSERNSIANWGTMGSSMHKDSRSFAIGLKPPYLKPFFGMYGYGGVLASLFLGGLVTVSSKTKSAKRVVTLRLEKDVMMEEREPDKVWRTPGTIRDITDEERKLSPHGSFTKVHISKLKSNYWNERQLKCMLKDIYFPYIQNDGSGESLQTSMPVEFEVNGTNLTEVEGGEVATTNLAACNGPKFIIEIHLAQRVKIEDCGSSGGAKITSNTANARLSCLYFPIAQGKETTDEILEKLNKESGGNEKHFESFCPVSIRRLGRLLPDARWGLLPFMKPPKPKRGEKPKIPMQCFQRVKCYVETDAGFVPTPNKTDLCHNEPFTKTLTSLGRNMEANGITVKIEREGRRLNPGQLEEEYQEWLKVLHESFDEEVECIDDQPILLVNPKNWKDFGFSSSSTEYGSGNNVVRVLTKIRRKGVLWKSSDKIKIQKGAYGLKKNLFATIEHILCQGFDGDPGEARMICRPIDCPEENQSKVVVLNNNVSFELGKSVSYPLELVSLEKCQKIDDIAWKRKKDDLRMKAPSFIDFWDREDSNISFCKAVKEGLTLKAGFLLPMEIIAVVRPHRFTIDGNGKEIDRLNQKYIFKESLEMLLEIKSLSDCECLEDCSHEAVKFKLLSKASSYKQIDGMYRFSMEGHGLSEMFTKAGNYRLILSLVNSPYPLVKPAIINIHVQASDTVGRWELNNLSDSELYGGSRHTVRLGFKVGPISISRFDTYSNRMNFEPNALVDIDILREGVPVPVNLQVHGSVSEDNMHLHYKEIILDGGDIAVLRPSFEATLRISEKELCYIEIPLRILPGKVKSVRVLDNKRIDKLVSGLRPGDIILDLCLQALDAYGNPVEKGQKLKLELRGLQFQDKDYEIREVDEDGCLNLGGLLKVVGKYGTVGCIQVSSGSEILLQKELHILEREMRIISEIPRQCPPGSVLQNVEFAVYDERGEIDCEINGCKHTLMVNLHNGEEIQYSFKDGKCRVSTIQLPNECGQIEFTACHALHPELSVPIKIDLVPTSSLEMVCVQEEMFDKCSPNNCMSLEQALIPNPTASPIKPEESLPIDLIMCFMDEISKWQEGIKRQAAKVKKLEDEVLELKNKKRGLEDSVDEDNRELKKYVSMKGDSRGIPVDSSHSHEETLQEIKRHKASASAIWIDFGMRNKQLYPILHRNIIGVVALLGKVENDDLNYALSEYIGVENMLAIVCKTKEGVGALERYDPTGKLDARTGIHSLASEHRLQIVGRFRTICLEDIGSYDSVCMDDPQCRLNIDNPKLENGNTPDGFLGYAVNMIHLDDKNQYASNVSPITLRQSLFFHLFSYLQVYKTRRDMKQAIKCIKDGAVSLDGGMRRSKGVIECGKRNLVTVRFPTTFDSALHVQRRGALERKIREKTEEIKCTEAKMECLYAKLDKSRAKFHKKKEELSEKENKATALAKHFKNQPSCA